MSLIVWFVRDRLRGNEIAVKTLGVRIEQLLNSLVALGLQNEAGVVILRHAINDFGVCICGSIRVLLAGERKNDARIVVTLGRKLIRMFPCPYFEPCPLAPEIDARCGLNDVGDISAADTSGHFDEIEFAFRVRPQELGMGHAAHEAKTLD